MSLILNLFSVTLI